MTTKVKTKLGVLVGARRKTQNGFEYDDFLNIPYAKPPVGYLRFKSPQPPDPWQGERNSTVYSESNLCIQYDLFKRIPRGSEDCLYINVSTPKVPTVGLLMHLLPVMVFIHGGGFFFGNGLAKFENGPDYLIEHNVVVVTMNYRLSALGFLALDIPEASGNMGLKDQALALKWVQENIADFGGNKDDVTIFGIGAGAASVEYHVISPLSTGLFHKAIMQSGSVLNPWAIETSNKIKDLAFKLARNLNYQGKGLYYGFVPTIEQHFGYGEAFLTEIPYDLLTSGRFNKVPVMRGFTDSEGFIISGLKPQDIKEITMLQNYVDYWRFPFNTSTDTYYYNERFRHVYNTYKGNDTERPAIDFFGDFEFVSGIIISSKLMVKNAVPVYLYEFSYDGTLNLIKAASRVTKKGAGHADDTAYTILIEPRRNLTQNDVTVRDRISTMWTNFAKFSNPTPNISNLLPLYWPPYSTGEQFLMIINKDLSTCSKYAEERIQLFEDIMRKYHR
ncbi:unnamed protein product [Spodoptera littoralis]|uniref:Carboxylesterase type B domain-containing protein n=1 Tax=Spodoptera littoralis TaxID=7109 RepID=A0A9P0N260_SPOLI|nr:unnamed protein product [Spodoptera littoralis]CAH1638812.1 unnamed protein product [Spodoptera littoralis]